MIKIRQERHTMKLNGAEKKIVECPQCKKEDWFYSYLAYTCDSCDFYWGNISALIDNVDARTQYYKEGEVSWRR